MYKLVPVHHGPHRSHHPKHRVAIDAYHLAKHRYGWYDFIRQAAAYLSVVAVISVAGQLAYPHDRTLPLTRINGTLTGLADRATITDRFAAGNNTDLRINAAAKVYDVKPADIGLAVPAAKLAARALDYPWTSRIVPFSILAKRSVDTSYELSQPVTMDAFVATLVAENTSQPVDATISVKAGVIVITPEEAGRTYDARIVMAAVNGLATDSDSEVSITPLPVAPRISDKAVKAAAEKATARLKIPLNITVAGKGIAVKPADMAGWFSFTADAAANSVALGYDKVAVGEYLKQYAGLAHIAPDAKSVILEDGALVGGSNGAEGQALDADVSAQAVLAALSEMKSEAEASVVAIAPGTQVIRRYTRTSRGMQALIDQWAAQNPVSFSVVVKSLEGQEIYAARNADKQYASASMYKLFIASTLYQKAARGEVDLNAVGPTGRTISSCINLMIYRSDNACGEGHLNWLGRPQVENAIHSQGYSRTVFGNYAISTSADITKWMSDLYKGTLVQPAHKSALEDMMFRQAFKHAIRTGITNVRVINKTGDNWMVNNDAGIVYGKNGAYVITIMSGYMSSSKMVELSRQIHGVMK